jgi:predicted Rossmann fold flavoprotein
MEPKYNVAIIGAGPAGMMAAIQASRNNKSVVLIDTNRIPGQKLLITGKGRCNITNAEFDKHKLVENYGKNGKFLYHAFSEFGPQEVMDFFSELNLKIERGNRVFPKSDDARYVLKSLNKKLKNVKTIYGIEVLKVIKKDNKIEKLVLSDRELRADKYIICTGGKSYPQTGSTGDGYNWAEKLGHSIVEPMPALVPMKTVEDWPRELQGLSLKNIQITFKQDKIIEKVFGECLFTHFGISGPIILTASEKISKFLKKGHVKAFIDLKPGLDVTTLDKRVQRDLKRYSNKSFINSLDELFPKKIIPVLVRLSGIDPQKKVNLITKDERKIIVFLIKNVEITINELMGFDWAIITQGGVDLKEIDPNTMKSRIIDNLYFAGEVIDINGVTGGFNLQACWSTGFIAGNNV